MSGCERHQLSSSEQAARLEALWSGQFGDAYVDRNRGAGEARAAFWRTILDALRPADVLEIGCNIGGNLKWIAGQGGVTQTCGLDVNQKALAELRDTVPAARPLVAAARALPFRDSSFDLVFTMGVLIHQPDESLPDVLDETVRCSRRFVLCGEYYAPTTEEVPYRGERGALFKRDYGRLYADRFADDLRLVRQGFLMRSEGWDDVTFWLFERAR